MTNWLHRRSPMDRLASKRRKQLRAKATRHELLVMDALRTLGIRFLFQKAYLCKGQSVRVVDFALPRHRLILEIDGPSHAGIIARRDDKEREEQILLSVPKYSFLRITNDEIDEHSKFLSPFLYRRIENARAAKAHKFDLGNAATATQGAGAHVTERSGRASEIAQAALTIKPGDQFKP